MKEKAFFRARPVAPDFAFCCGAAVVAAGVVVWPGGVVGFESRKFLGKTPFFPDTVSPSHQPSSAVDFEIMRIFSPTTRSSSSRLSA